MENNKPVMLIKFDNEKYYNTKYMKDRDFYTNEKHESLHIYSIWTPNLYHDFEGEMENLKRKILSIKRIG